MKLRFFPDEADFMRLSKDVAREIIDIKHGSHGSIRGTVPSLFAKSFSRHHLSTVLIVAEVQRSNVNSSEQINASFRGGSGTSGVHEL